MGNRVIEVIQRAFRCILNLQVVTFFISRSSNQYRDGTSCANSSLALDRNSFGNSVQTVENPVETLLQDESIHARRLSRESIRSHRYRIHSRLDVVLDDQITGFPHEDRAELRYPCNDDISNMELLS